MKTSIDLPISRTAAERAERVVFKYPLPVQDFVDIQMPIRAEPLTVQVQGDTICLWALVNPNSAMERRSFRIAGTGHSLDCSGKYIGTVQLAGGSLIFHVFEVTV